MMTTDQRAELDAAMEKATDGEWRAYNQDNGEWDVSVIEPKSLTIGYNVGNVFGRLDAAAIVALHNAYPLLTATIDAQAAEIARLREALEWYAYQMCEHSTCFEGCGKLTADACAGCPARAALTSTGAA